MQKNLKLLGVIAILGASLAISGIVFQDAIAANSSNKSVYSTEKPVSVLENAQEVLATTTMKTSKPTDVLVLYNEECSLYTEVNLKSNKQSTGTSGDEIDTSHMAHKVQLFVDGNPIGKEITMCDRTYGIQTNILNQIQDLCVAVDDIYDTVDGTSYTCDETFLNSWIKTKSAHNWNWVVLNLGQNPEFNTDGPHTFEVKGTTINEDDTTDVINDAAGTVVGEVSLIVIPTQLDVGAQ